MNKQEAIQAMKEGKKVTHQYFSDGEFMKFNGNKYEFEDGVKLTMAEFDQYRIGIEWETNWNIVN